MLVGGEAGGEGGGLAPDRCGKAPGMARGSNLGPANMADRSSGWPPDGQRTEHAREKPYAQST